MIAPKINEAVINTIQARLRRERMSKQRILEDRTKIISYLKVCVNTGQTHHAINFINYYTKSKKHAIIEKQHYNIILHGLARSNSIEQMYKLRQNMLRHQLKPDTETYSSFIYMASRLNEGREEVTDKLFKEMEENHIPLEALFQSTYYSEPTRKHLRNFLKTRHKQYNDRFWNVPIQYSCQLLDKLSETPAVPYSFAGDVDLSKLDCWAEEQRLIEEQSSVVINSIANPPAGKSSSIEKFENTWQKLVALWRTALSKALDESLESLEKQMSTSKMMHLYPYLISIDKKSLVQIMLEEVENNTAMSSFSLSTRYLHMILGQRVMSRYLRDAAQADGSYDEVQKVYTDYIQNYCKNPALVGEMTPREYVQRRAIETKNYGVFKDKLSTVEEWPRHVVVAVGRFLYGLILREVKFDPIAGRSTKREIDTENLVRAFYTAYFQINHTHKNKEEFRVHKELETLYQRASAARLRFDHSQLPSSSPPMPWLSSTLGGYLTHKSNLIRTNTVSAETMLMTKSSIDDQQLYPSLDSLNSLGLCPWIVNKEILDIVIDIFRAGGNTDLSVPLHQSKMDANEPILPANASKADKILYNKEKKKYDQRKREMYSLWSDCLYRLSIANHFRDRVFWFPHNVDFRGRTYPFPPHFNHLGADLARSLLLFARGRPLGPKGLDWLKIHVINLVGNKKKCSLRERLEYADSILESHILDSARNPFTGRKWWMNNEHPWQVLACCKEIDKAIGSGNPAEYVSHFPVHQDGSCNGLQHYAALGRDPLGGLAVNLVPSEKPQDVYSRVVEIAEATRQNDAAKGVNIAKKLEGYITRKTIKQTVMTTVYGVTHYGARLQIYRQLTAKAFPDNDAMAAASYLSKVTFESIGKMFNSSRAIQDWFNDCARLIATRYRKPVSWDTPLGFPVSQPYYYMGRSSSRYFAPSLRCIVPVQTDNQSHLNVSKQKTAFPPNYIHSLDSSHMMLTSLYCHRMGITFVSVHDCYWTHACTVDEMNKICREQFVMLHSLPLLEDLSDQFINYVNSSDAEQASDDERVKDEYAAAADEAESAVFDEYDLGDDEQDELAPKRGRKKKQPVADTPKESHLEATEEAELKSRAILRRVPRTGSLDLNSVLNSVYFFS